jgi:hypothetical protein
MTLFHVVFRAFLGGCMIASSRLLAVLFNGTTDIPAWLYWDYS